MSNKWRVWNFDCDIDTTVKTRKRKRKSNVNIRKKEADNIIIQDNRPQTPVVQEISSESSSPIIGSYRNATVQNNDSMTGSPILNSALTYSQTDPDTSPVINRNITKVIKMQKCRLALKNKARCTRQLQELKENNNSNTSASYTDKENRIRKVCDWMDGEENYEIEVENSQTSPSPVKAAKHKSWIHIDRTSDDGCLNNYTLLNKNSNYVDKSDNLDTHIELVNSQDLSEHSSPILASGGVRPLWNCNVPNTRSNLSYLSSLEPLLTNKFPESTQNSPTSEQSLTNHAKLCSKPLKNSLGHLYSQEERFEIELVSSQDTSSVPPALAVSRDRASPQIQVSDVSSPRTGSSSQASTAVSINSNYTVVPDSLEGSSYETLYNLPKRTRKYKPGTLAHQFHKLLRRQKADIGIWRHEMYLSRTSDYKMPATKDDHLIAQLKIVKIYNDFSLTVFECFELASGDKCLLVADVSGMQDQPIVESEVIQIYPPYFVNYYNINNENRVKTYLNVHKIVGIQQ